MHTSVYLKCRRVKKPPVKKRLKTRLVERVEVSANHGSHVGRWALMEKAIRRRPDLLEKIEAGSDSPHTSHNSRGLAQFINFSIHIFNPASTMLSTPTQSLAHSYGLLIRTRLQNALLTLTSSALVQGILTPVSSSLASRGFVDSQIAYKTYIWPSSMVL